jgi:hypothetical protein
VGWDKGRYFTRSKKVDGRVVREYFGTGRVAVLAAQLFALERERREFDAAAHRAEKDDLASLAAGVGAAFDQVELITRAALLAAGYRRHKRGEWRKRREHADDAG